MSRPPPLAPGHEYLAPGYPPPIAPLAPVGYGYVPPSKADEEYNDKVCMYYLIDSLEKVCTMYYVLCTIYYVLCIRVNVISTAMKIINNAQVLFIFKQNIEDLYILTIFVQFLMYILYICTLCN